MKKILFAILFLNPLFSWAQKSNCILFDLDNLHNAVKVAPFELYYNVATITSKSENDLTFNIYDIYFSRYHFSIFPVEEKYFHQALTDYTKFRNDLLVVITPLYDNNAEEKYIDVTDSVNSGKLKFISYKDLLKEAISNLYSVSFPETNFCNDSMINEVGHTKQLDMRLVIKKADKYFFINNYTLTEFYYVSDNPVTFPNELTFGGINLPVSPSKNNYFSPTNFTNLSAQFKDAPSAIWEHFKKEVFGRIYCAGIDTLTLPNINVYNYWTIAIDHQQKFYKLRWPGDPFPIRNGSNIFQFVGRIGLVNGNYEFFLNKLLRNVKTELGIPSSIKYNFTIEKINNMPLPEFTKWYEKKYSSKESL